MTSANPTVDVLNALVALTRDLGRPDRDLAILAEGNTATLIADDRFAVKASGAMMASVGPGDFVVGSLQEFNALLDDPLSSQDDLFRALGNTVTLDGGEPVRASIETLVHVVALVDTAMTWSAHTHPTAALGLLCVAESDELWSQPYFPDEAVVLGLPLYVPYAAPGIALGRAVRDRLRDYLELHQAAPRLVLLGNHGIVALGTSPSEVLAISDMASKAARVRAIAHRVGTPRPLDSLHAHQLANREDELLRRRRLASSS